MSDIKPLFSGEVQFVTYADSSKSGPRVTLRLPDRDQLQAFIGKEGKRFMAVLVEIGDDEQPVQYPPGAVVPADKNMRPLLGPIAYWLVERCKEPEFQAWLTKHGDFAAALDEKKCRDVICAWCEVASRKEIDNDPDATRRFERLIRRPYMNRHKSGAEREMEAV